VTLDHVDGGRCPLCGAEHSACGTPGTGGRPVDILETEARTVSGTPERRWVAQAHARPGRPAQYALMNIAPEDPLYADSHPYNGESVFTGPDGAAGGSTRTEAANKARTTTPGGRKPAAKTKG
jgi:hypothetical protein